MGYQSEIFSKYLGDEEMQQLVSDEALIQKMLQFEQALARAQGNAEIIPSAAAKQIDDVLNYIPILPADLTDSTLQNGVPVIGFLSLVKQHFGSDIRQWLHYGATSQDVLDTAWALIIKDAIAVIEGRMGTLKQQLTKLHNAFSSAPCTAHTRGQQAMPTTFGAKIEAWLQPLLRHQKRLPAIKNNVLVIQLGGAVGTLDKFRDKGPLFAAEFASEIGLFNARPWHTQRDNLCEFTNWLAMLTGTLGKMGADILVMAQSEIGEIVESADGGKSSAMPHKNNPVLSEALVAIARMNANLQAQMLQGMVHANERDATAWILEWDALPRMLINTAAALAHAITISEKMQVDTEAMKRNVDAFEKVKKE